MIRNLMTYLAVIAGMALFSGLFIVLFANSVETSCVREATGEVNCRITRKLLGRFPLGTRDVLGITDVRIEEDCDDGCSYRLLLITSGGQSTPLNDVYTDRGPVRRQQEAFSGFLAGTETSFAYKEPVMWWVIFLVGGMDLVATAFIVWNFLRGSRAR